jgi:hypothetical protein
MIIGFSSEQTPPVRAACSCLGGARVAGILRTGELGSVRQCRQQGTDALEVAQIRRVGLAQDGADLAADGFERDIAFSGNRFSRLTAQQSQRDAWERCGGRVQ